MYHKFGLEDQNCHDHQHDQQRNHGIQGDPLAVVERKVAANGRRVEAHQIQRVGGATLVVVHLGHRSARDRQLGVEQAGLLLGVDIFGGLQQLVQRRDGVPLLIADIDLGRVDLLGAGANIRQRQAGLVVGVIPELAPARPQKHIAKSC